MPAIANFMLNYVLHTKLQYDWKDKILIEVLRFKKVCRFEVRHLRIIIQTTV